MRPAPDSRVLAVLLVVAGLWYAGVTLFSGGADPGRRAQERHAARAMAAAIAAVAREAPAPDPATDPNRTGLVGLPFTPITTTLGSLPAKRTGAQPDAAALMARLMTQAGVQPGSRVAIESSGSFPGFAIAALVAARSLGAEAVPVVSIGASQYGANRPGFTLPDMLAVLARRGLIQRGPLAVSPGGGSDRGGDMDPHALEPALSRAAALGARILRPAGLAADVATKRAILDSKGRPAVFVSVGGNWAAAGPGESLLGRTGLLTPGRFKPEGTGLIQSYLRDQVPVIRVLDVQDLCVRTGLPFDPIPWPAEGRSSLYRGTLPPRPLIALGPALAILAAVLAKRRR
ncbi:MAG: poly-gamma-glutamate system protein [Holophaga sp.]|nr:poly-gamma-glutamate system protein [Holophaga sp.]